MLKKKFPSLASIGSDGNTAFLRAARAGHLDKVLEQLKNNVDINTSNANGLNALHLASKDGHINVVSELLRRGAKVDSATKKGNTALHIASLAGQEEVVKHLVEHGACVNVQSQNGFTPLYMAAQENHDAVVRFLLANGANQSLATEDGFTPLAVAMQQGHDKVVAVLLENDTRGKVRLPALHIAAKKDDCKAAALLLQNEHNPDVTSKSGFTPLHIASHYGNEAIANLLLSKNADVNYAAKHNITPLHVAAKWGKANMVSVLLSRGANIEAKTRDGLTPLHCAARSGHEQVVDMLLERGAPISAKTKNGLAALHMSSQGDHVDAARILLYHRAPVDDVTVDYLTALHVAAHCGHVGVARLLLDRKADPNARALNGFTPLHIACKKNRIKVVELLLKHGASIEATTESGLTPLHVASFMGCMNIVIYLVQNEAGPDVKTVRGETPLHLAARANQTDIIRILLRNGAQVDARAREQQTPLHIASRLGNVDIVMLLLQHGASVDSTTKDLYTALHIAAKEGQDEVASVLLENGASLEATTKKGFTPLHLAAKYGHMNVAKLLLRRDAPVDAQGKNGVTPLHVASHYDHQNVALLLLEKGASPHATAKNGHTPLHIAARKNQMDIATTLLEYGAKANSESKAGFTPLHLSAQEGHCDMSNLLIEHQADVNHKAKNGLTPLHLCSQEDRVEVGGILLKNESDVNSTTKAGYTPLHVACHFGQMGMVRLLLANGAAVTPTTAVNYTPLHQAAQQGHSVIVNELLAAGADPNATTNQGQTAMSIAQKLGYISVMETLKGVTDAPISPTTADEKYKVVSPETMQETFMSDSEDEGGEDTMLSEQPYHYLTVDEMKGLGDDSLPIDVTRDERDNRDMDDTISPQHMKESYTTFAAADNVDINRHPLHVGFLVSFLVDARGGAMRGVRHSGVRVIVPPRRASMPLRVTCRYLKRDKLPHPPPLMEGEALASRILELGPVGAKFLGPVMIEVPHFGSLRGKEREIVILRSDNGETWREHTFEASEEAVHDVLSSSFEKDELSQYEENPRMTRILTTEFPHYIAVVSRVRQEVHAIGPEGGMVSSTVVPQVQAVFPHGALTKKIKVGLQAQPIPAELTAKLLGNRVAVSPIVTVEPRRRKFHKPISLTIPVPQAANKGMINQYSGDAPTLRLLCSITGGTTRAQWEDVTGSTPLTFVNDCVSFTTTVSARFWLMDCRNITEATKMATELYREAIHVPFMAKFVVFAKRVDTTEARLRVFCMTDDKEDKTLEHQEHFTEVAKSRDVEVLEGKTQYLEFAGNLVPVTKSGEQLQLGFRAFKENRLPFTVRVKDPHADAIGRTIFMREPKVAKGDVPQQPICILNIVLPEEIIPEPDLPEHEAHKHSYITHTSGLQRLSDISNLLGEDWVRLAGELGVSTSEVNSIKTELCESSVAHQGLAMLRLWLQNAGNKASASSLEQGLRNIGRDDIIQQTVFQTGTYAISEELSPSYTTKQGVFKRIPGEKREIIEERRIEERIPKDEGRDISIGERTPQIEERVSTKEERRMTIDKDDGDEKKYVAEEKAVEEESLKSVSERKKEIEKRLSQDIDDKTTKEKVITKETKITIKETKVSKETVVTKETTSTKETSSKDTKTEKSKKLLDDTTEKETAEEKAVSPEPAHLSFDEKRKSFEMGITPKEKVKQQDSLTEAVKPTEAVTAAFIAEESKASVQEVKKETKAEEKEEEEKEMSFAEKRRSFEQGLSMKQPGDKLPAAERKKEAATDRKAEEEKRVSDFRRDSELFQEVSQGLDNIEKGIVKPAAQELLSPGVARTPPPSPADFIKDAPDNKKWSVETTSNLLSGQDDKPRGADKSKEAVESSWLSRQDQVREDVKKTPIQEKKSKESQKDAKAKDKGKGDDLKKEPIKKNDKPSLDRKDSIKRVSPDKTPEPSKKVSPVKTDKKPLERRDSKKTPSPEKTVSMVKTTVTKVKSTEESTTAPTEKITIKSQKSLEKTDESYIETANSKLKSTEKTKTESLNREISVKEKNEEKGKGKQKKGNNGQSGGMKEDKIKVEENISKQAVEPARVTEKKSTILGKTIETIKKPFQDKGGDKTVSKDEKGKGKGKGKGKQKSIDSIKSPSQESDVPVEVQEPKEDEIKTETQPMKHETGEITAADTSKTTKKTKFENSIVEKSKETISQVLDEKNIRGQPDDKSKGKGEGKGIVPEPPTTISLSRTTSQEQEESIKDTKHGKSKLKDNGKGKDEESPKETKGKGKVKEKSQSPKTEPIEKVDAKGEKQVSAQIDKSSEDKKNGGDKGTTKHGNGKGKSKGKVEQPKQQSADRVSVEEPLIEKAVHDISVITVGSLDKEVEEIVKKDDKESSKDDKNKGKGKDKIKDKSGPAKIPSFEESDKPLKPDTSVVGKAVEMIKKPFQDQTKPMDDTKTTQKAGKGKKQRSVESPKSPSIDKDYEAAKIHTELSSQSHSETKVEEKSTKPGSGESEKKIEKVVVKDDKINERKGKQKPIESTKSVSPEKDTRKIAQNEPTVESTSTEKIKDRTSPEPSKKEGKKKGKGKQKSIESLKKPSVENDEDNSRALSTSEPTLIEKTLETIKRPFQGKKDDKSASKQGQVAAGKKQEGKSKQKSIESASRQSSTEQEPKVETKITTETVRLIKELSQDKSGQAIEGQAIDLVTKPFGDKSSLLKSNDYASPVDESSRTATLIKELSQEKSGQQIEGKAIESVSKPFELKDIETLPSGGKVETTSTIVTLTKELSQEASSQIIDEKGIDIVSQPFQEAIGAQKNMGDAPSSEKESISSYTPIKELSVDRSGQVIGKKGIELVSKPLEQKHTKTIPSEETTTTKIISITKELSQDKSGLVIEEEEMGIVSKPLQEMQSTTSIKEGTTIGEPLITELSKEKSGFIIEERPIDLVSQPLQNMKETTLFSTTLPSADTKVLSKSQEVDKYSITGPLIEKLHQEKSGFIIEERPIDLVSQPFQDILLTAPHFSSGDMITESTKLIEKLSQDRSGQIIEGKPIELVSGPLQGSLLKTLREEKTQVTGPLIEELSHKKSGFIIEERPIDLVSQPFQDILETSKSTELPPSGTEGNKSAVTKLEERTKDSGRLSDSITTKSFVDTKKQPPSTLEGSARAVSLMTELSQDKSGQVIEEGAIDLVAQPFLGGLGRKEDAAKTKKKDSKTKAEEHKKRDESTGKKNDFEHIQKTIDDAKTQFDQFVGIVSDKAAKSSPGKTNDATNEKESTSTTTVTKITTRPFVIEERNILRSNDQEVEIPVEKEEDLLRIQKSIQHGFQNIPSGTAGAIDVNTVTTTTTTEPIQYEADKFSVDGIFSAIDKNVKKVSEAVIESKDGAVTVIKTTIKSQVKPVKDASATLVEKTTTVKGTLPKDSLLNFGEITNASITQDDEKKDPLNIRESIQQGAQNVQLEKVGKIDVNTITTTVTKPIEQGTGNIFMKAEEFVGAIDKNVRKASEAVEKSVEGGVTVIGKTIESKVKTSKDAPASLVEKTQFTIQGTLPNDDWNTQVQQVLKNIPSENIGISDDAPIKPTVTKPIEQKAENISIQAEKIKDVIDKSVKKVKESVEKSFDTGETVIKQTIETQVKPLEGTPTILVEKSIVTVQQPLDDAFEKLGKLAHNTEVRMEQSQIITKGGIKDIGNTIEAAGLDAVGKVANILNVQRSEHQHHSEPSESFLPELRAQSVKVATFETVETIFPTGTEDDKKPTMLSEVTGSSNDEIGRIIKEMESQLLSTKFGMDDSTVDEGSEVECEDYARESRTMPTTPMPVRKMFGDIEAISDSEGGSKPYVTTPTLSRRVIGVGGSQRLTQDERPVVRVITEYVGDLSESEPEEDTYTVLEPEVKERRKFKIRFSPDMYGSEDKEEMEEPHRPDSESLDTTIEPLEKSDSKKSEKNIKRIERKFERMTSQTKEADPSMSEVMDGEFQRMVSQLSLEEMDQALHQWDAGGLTPSEIDSKDLTLSSDDTTSPLQQGLTDIFRPKLSSILPTSIYVEKTGTEVGSSGLSESSKMKLSLVKDSVPQIFQSVETDSQVRGDSIKTEQEQKQTVETHRRERDEESQEGAYGFSESKLKGTKK